jgi:D-beta-D-heptose 7-phosphate kinase/D-beta-D-heptose 1-phosphate adenosyltransferase
VVGDDGQAARLREQLATRGVGASAVLTDPNRRTTTKMRIVTDRHQQVARVDYESEADISDELEDGLAKAADRLAAASGAIIVSDYLKGGITAGLMTRLVDIARRREIPVLVDPKVPHIGFYRHTRMVTPNHHEAEIATNRRIRTDSDALAAARDFRERAGCEGVLITRGEHGMWLLDGETEGSLAAVAREVSDVTGAGDTVIATLALAFAAGASMAEAATLANHAGGVSVGKFGPSTVDRAELIEALAVGRD